MGNAFLILYIHHRVVAHSYFPSILEGTKRKITSIISMLLPLLCHCESSSHNSLGAKPPSSHKNQMHSPLVPLFIVWLWVKAPLHMALLVQSDPLSPSKFNQSATFSTDLLLILLLDALFAFEAERKSYSHITSGKSEIKEAVPCHGSKEYRVLDIYMWFKMITKYPYFSLKLKNQRAPSNIYLTSKHQCIQPNC